MSNELQTLISEVAAIKIEVKHLGDEVKSLKETNNLLLQFMYKMQGGKALFFGMLTAAAALGSIITYVTSYTIHK